MMDWEKKFYDIVRETESNLASARRKLHAQAESSARYGILSESRTHEEYAYQPKSAIPKGGKVSSAPVSSVNWRDDVKVNYARQNLGLTTPAPVASTSTSATTPALQYNSEIKPLVDKIEAQNLVIQKLERLVQTLDTEREQYQRQIRDLKSEVGNVSSRVHASRNTDSHMEAQLDMMRREVKSEIQRLQSMLNTNRTSSLYCNVMERSFRDMKDNMYEEMDDLRRDLSTVTQRVGRLELDVSVPSTSYRDHQDRVRPDTSYSSHAGLNSNFRYGQNTSFSVQPLHELRLTVSQLHDKLDRLESRLATSRAEATTKQPLFTNGFKTPSSAATLAVKPTTFSEFDGSDNGSLDNSDLDDLDLSDDLEHLKLSDGLNSDTDVEDGSLMDDIEDMFLKQGKNYKQKSPVATTFTYSRHKHTRKVGKKPPALQTEKPVKVKAADKATETDKGIHKADTLSDAGSSVDSDNLNMSAFDLDSLEDGSEVRLEDL